ncbi:MAG: sugar ABC transporter permease, partial [Cutibacterium avidum]|nr:sugar ABC transporter permease [Cutibacterium avidum]
YASALSVVLFFLTLIPLATIGWANNKDLRSGRKPKQAGRRARRAAAVQAATKETMA